MTTTLTPLVDNHRNTEALDTFRALMPHSDLDDDARPKVGEVGLTKAVQDVLMRGGGTPRERSHVAVGLIEAKVRRAYKLEDAA